MNQIYWCQEVEEAFERMASGHKGAMKVGGHGQALKCNAACTSLLVQSALVHPSERLGAEMRPLSLPSFLPPPPAARHLAQAYNELQVKQLTRLIEVTRTNLSKADRQKVWWGGQGRLGGALGRWLVCLAASVQGAMPLLCLAPPLPPSSDLPRAALPPSICR